MRWGDSSCVDLQVKTVIPAQAGVPFPFFLAQLCKRSNSSFWAIVAEGRQLPHKKKEFDTFVKVHLAMLA